MSLLSGNPRSLNPLLKVSSDRFFDYISIRAEKQWRGIFSLFVFIGGLDEGYLGGV